MMVNDGLLEILNHEGELVVIQIFVALHETLLVIVFLVLAEVVD